MEKLNQNIPISGIDINSADYGSQLNDRLDAIDANFKSIITYDYLRGNDGVSVGVEPWVVNITTTDITEKTHIDAIVTAISSLADNWDKLDHLTQTNIILEIKKYLNGKTIYLVKKTSGELVSSLPFVYIDYRYELVRSTPDKDLQVMFKDVRDLSCVICYNETFKAVQSFPTIYWDSSITTGEDSGDLCWMINGEKTGLTCRGPQGANGISGRIYTAFYNVDKITANDLVNFPIVAVLSATKNDENLYVNEYVYAEDFASQGIFLNTGDTVIGIPCRFSNNGSEKTITPSTDVIFNGTGVTDQTMTKYTISTVYRDESTIDPYKKYIIVSDGKSVEIPLILEEAILSQIILNTKTLYVPVIKENNNVKTAHALWGDPENNNNMCLGTIQNPDSLDGTPFVPVKDASLSIRSNVFKIGLDDPYVTKTKLSDNTLHITQTAGVAPDHHSELIQEFDKYAGEFTTYGIKSTNLLHLSQNSTKGTDGVWGETSDKIYSFNATEFIPTFSINYLNVLYTVTDQYIPICDLGEHTEYPDSRFRCVYKTGYEVGGSNRISYFIIFAANITKLYNFFENCINEYARNGLNCNINHLFSEYYTDVRAGFTDAPNGEIVSILDVERNDGVTIASANIRECKLKRNFEKIYKDEFVWNLLYYNDGEKPKPYVINTIISPEEQFPFILCRSYDLITNGAPDNHLYKLVRINDNQRYEYDSLIENVTIVEQEGYIQNAYQFDTPDNFNSYAVPESKLYEEDKSSDRLRADKIIRFCNEYMLNGINLLDKIAELEDRIKVLEDGVQ